MIVNPETRAKALQLHVEDLMLVMNASKVKKDNPLFGGYLLPLHTFDRAEPLTALDITHSEYGDTTVHTEVWPGDLDGKVDVTLLSRATQDISIFGEDLVVRRFRTVRRARLPLRQMARYIVEENRLFLNRQNGAGFTSLRYYGINQPDRAAWIDLQRGKPLRQVNANELQSVWAALGIQFNRDYHWHVHLKWAGADIGVYLPTTAAGCRELFKLRDYEPGASRRKALAHWVTEHSRRIRKDTDEETFTWVREHMRGATSFKWQDMEGAIHPSGYDLRRLAAAAEQSSPQGSGDAR